MFDTRQCKFVRCDQCAMETLCVLESRLEMKGLSVVCVRDTCAILHPSPHIRAYVSHASSCVESAVQSARLENCATAKLAPLFSSTHQSLTDRSTTHPQYSSLCRCRCICARLSEQAPHHHIFVAHVGVVQHAHSLGRLPWCHSTITFEQFRSSIFSTIPPHDFHWPARRQHPCVSIATRRPLLQSEEFCLLVVVRLGSTLLAHPRPSHQPQAKTPP